jgi:hypothetical protein
LARSGSAGSTSTSCSFSLGNIRFGPGNSTCSTEKRTGLGQASFLAECALRSYPRCLFRKFAASGP